MIEYLFQVKEKVTYYLWTVNYWHDNLPLIDYFFYKPLIGISNLQVLEFQTGTPLALSKPSIFKINSVYPSSPERGQWKLQG